jgi:DNA-binding transcriptional LysR family regulator
MARSPAISLEIVAGSTHQLADALVRHELDLLVCERLDRKSKAVSTEVLYESTMVAVARPEHPLCATPPADLVGLLAYPLVTSHVPHPILDVLRRDYDIDLDSQPGRIVCSDFEMLVRVVSASPTALTVGPRFTFAPELKAGIFAVIDIEFPFRNSICLHTSRDAYPLPAVTRAAEIIRELFAEMRAR